jgi:Secretion system C-terminal sorting domain
MKKKWLVFFAGFLSLSLSFAQVETADRVLSWSIGKVKIERKGTIKVTYPLMAAMSGSGQPKLGTSTIRFFYDAGYLENLQLEKVAHGYQVSGLNQSNNVLGEIFDFPGGGGVFAQFSLIANEQELIPLSGEPIHIMDISFRVKAGARMISCIPLVLDNHLGSQGLGARFDYGYLQNEGGIVGTYYLDGFTDELFLADDEVRNYLWEFKSDFASRPIRSTADRTGARLPSTLLAASGCVEAMKEILPISLHKFTASGQGENQVFLEWTTLSEFDNDYFEVQRSEDGVEFITIGKVKGFWNAVEETGYGFVDNQAHPGNLFYQLRQVDGSGKATLSEVRMVTLYPLAQAGSGVEISCFPNPTSDVVNIICTGVEAAGISGLDLLLFDASGRLVIRKKALPEQSLLDLTDFKAGVYQVVVKNSDTDKILGAERIVLSGK